MVVVVAEWVEDYLSYDLWLDFLRLLPAMYVSLITLSRYDNSQAMDVLAYRATGYGVSTELKLLCSYVPYTTILHLARAFVSEPDYFTFLSLARKRASFWLWT